MNARNNNNNNNNILRRPGPPAVAALSLLLGLALLQSGCATIHISESRGPKVTASWRESALTRGELSPRSLQVLRWFDLAHLYPDRLPEASAKLHAEALRDPQLDVLFTLAELNYLRGLRAERNQSTDACVYYYLAAGYAYHFLFDERPAPNGGTIQRVSGSAGPPVLLLAPPAEAFDPRFRLACDLYNSGLAKCISAAQKVGQFDSCRRLVLPTGDGHTGIKLAVRHSGFGYRPEEFGPVMLCSEYKVTGLANHHRTYGLGVPLIGSRAQGVPRMEHALYPPRINFPVTAFFRFEGGLAELAERRAGWLELFNSLSIQTVNVRGRTVPLESDLTTPLAYFLANAELDGVGYKGFLCPDDLSHRAGLYALGPHESGKVPIVFVHGLFGSPLTWAPMVNDLQADPVLRRRFQFWFYFYPTGSSYLASTANLRTELARVRKELDPEGKSPELSDMVFVGHSMGGLVTRLMTIDGGDDFWHLVVPESLDSLRLQPNTRSELQNTFYFERQPCVTRAIFLGTPHRGAAIVPSVVGRVGAQLAGEPQSLLAVTQDLKEDNPELARELKGRHLPSSVELLAPDAPALKLIAHRPRPKSVHYHSIIGAVPSSELVLERVFGVGFRQLSDGVVPYSSAHLSDVDSEVVIKANHYMVHQHALAILEVRRILFEHLKDFDGRTRPIEQVSATK
jgi:pimeloyl-ACP methyl ester carboxylesterase